MKRLYLRDEARGTGVGLALTEASIAAAQAPGYREMPLDTLDTIPRPSRRTAFGSVSACYHDPVPRAAYLGRAP